MAEAKDILKAAVLIAAIVFLGAMVAGFYFTVVSPPGQQFLVGGMEQVLAAFFQFVAAPFTGMAHAITNFFSHLGL